MAKFLKNSDFINCWISAPINQRIKRVTEFVEHKFENSCVNKEGLKHRISLFNSLMSKKWKASNYNKKRLKKKVCYLVKLEILRFL